MAELLTITPPTPHRTRWLVAIGVLIIAFWLNSVLATSTKSATYDETVHTLSSWLLVNKGDFRINPEDPPLWKLFAGIGLVGQPLATDWESPESKAMLKDIDQQWVATKTALYTQLPAGKPPIYGESLIQRGRIGNSIFMLLLGVVVAWWAWSWSGPVAAVICTAVLAVEPSLLAHGSLVKNDMPAAFITTLAVFLTWRLGERLTIGRMVAWVVVCALALEIKLSCLLLAPMLGVPLLLHCLIQPASQTNRSLLSFTRYKRLLIVLVLCSAAFMTAIAFMWAIYLFREAPVPSGDRFSDNYMDYMIHYLGAKAEHDRNGLPPITIHDLRIQAIYYKPGLAVRFFQWVAEIRVLPQAWIFGLNNAGARSLERTAYLNGQLSEFGFFWFFPLTLLYKMPVAEIAMALAAAVAGFFTLDKDWRSPAKRWKLICLTVPPAIYLAAAIQKGLNIGVRHILPVYVPIIIAIGLAGSRLIRSWWPGKMVVGGAVAMMAIETLSVCPNYISFFNFPSGGARAGFNLLGDSNLDWGQDLPALSRWYKAWRAEHPTEAFRLSYFGSSDPRAYGIEFDKMETSGIKNSIDDPRGGIFAVSASHLQGIEPLGLEASFKLLKTMKPIAVINDTIYIYELPPKPATQPATTQASQ